MDDDLIESLINDIPQYTGINPRVVTREKVAALLESMNINCIASFGAFFTFDSACFAKFARIYRDVYIFDIPLEKACEINA